VRNSYDEDCGYLRGQPREWQDRCAGFDAVPDPKTTSAVKVKGRCPRCGHPIWRDLRSQRGVVAMAHGGNGEDLSYLMTCNCVYAHKDAPDGVHGCGAQGGVKVEGDQGSLTVSYVEVTPEQRVIEAWADDAVHNRLARTRAWAQQWMTLLTAVTGLVSFGAVIDAAGDLGALSLGWRTLYVTLGGMALACVVMAVVRAWQAANPIKIGALAADCHGRKLAYNEAVAYSAAQLADSYGWAIVAVLLLAASVATRVLTAPPPS
jgi:hypothetical protein